MKSNHQFKTHSRRIPICVGVHPPGGFVAWPHKQAITEEEKALLALRRRRMQGKGFIAWPEKDKLVNN